jgi:hypothetical protein
MDSILLIIYAIAFTPQSNNNWRKIYQMPVINNEQAEGMIHNEPVKLKGCEKNILIHLRDNTPFACNSEKFGY